MLLIEIREYLNIVVILLFGNCTDNTGIRIKTGVFCEINSVKSHSLGIHIAFYHNMPFKNNISVCPSPELNISVKLCPSSHGHGNGHMNGNRFISTNRVSYSDIKWC